MSTGCARARSHRGSRGIPPAVQQGSAEMRDHAAETRAVVARASPVRNSGPCAEFVWARSDLASQGEDAMADARAMCAIGRRGQLGLEGRLPWEGNPGPEYRADVQRFWDMTQGHVLIAGPSTFRSIPPEAHCERTIVEIRSRMAPTEVLARFPDRVVYVGGGPAVWTAYADLIRHWDITRLPYDGEADRWFDPAWLCGAGRS
jgi:dihydromethanopterin reductase